MRLFADLQEQEHRTVVRQGIERTRADGRQAVHQRGIDAVLRGKTHIFSTERIERDRHADRSSTREGGQCEDRKSVVPGRSWYVRCDTVGGRISKTTNIQQ